MGISQAESLPCNASGGQNPPKEMKSRERALPHKSHLWKTRLERAHRAVEMRSEFMRLRTEPGVEGKEAPKESQQKGKRWV